jgi:hypothetical protein
MSTILIVIILAAALVVAVGAAFVPMRLLLTHIASNIEQFILRQRERRVTSRVTPERRKEGESPIQA